MQFFPNKGPTKSTDIPSTHRTCAQTGRPEQAAQHVCYGVRDELNPTFPRKPGQHQICIANCRENMVGIYVEERSAV